MIQKVLFQKLNMILKILQKHNFIAILKKNNALNYLYYKVKQRE